MNWQHLNILAATNYLREGIASGVPDPHAKEVYEGLLDVLDPSRIERWAKAVAPEPARLKLDTTGEVRQTPDATSQPAAAKTASPPAKPARRRPARPARPAKPRRR
jgi:hypothetical protein